MLAAVDNAASTAGEADETGEFDDDLPLAVMVKQCLSGNSFMHTRSAGNSVTGMMRSGNSVTNSSGRNAVDGIDSGTAHTSSGSSSAQQSTQNNQQAQDSKQLADQPTDKLLAEQQDMVHCFNAFRSKLGVKPGKTMHCNVVRCLQ
jgi:hypothetical protein